MKQRHSKRERNYATRYGTENILTPRTVYAIKPYQVEGTACAYVCRVRVRPALTRSIHHVACSS